MTTTQTESEILKVDACGRVRASRKRRQKLLADQTRRRLPGSHGAARLQRHRAMRWLQFL
jgi:hypothetical protein